ncbi:MAG: DUF5011 domain-containing protein [bacterium]|nr:DUF5011 domain-containing protein [bacterium]
MKKIILLFLLSLSFSHLFATVNYEMQFGSYGSADGEFNAPVAVAVDVSSKIYVCDYFNHRVQVFDKDGVHQLSFGSFGSQNGEFVNPTGIAISSSDDIYVVDSGNNRVQIFNQSGIYQNTIINSFNLPIGITIDSADNIYVVDSNNSQFQKFNSTHTHQFSIGTFNNPRDVVVDSSGNIYVTDLGNNLVKKFDNLGNSLPDLPKITNDQSLYGITIDQMDNLYVSDVDADIIYKLTSTGTLITAISNVEAPSGLAVDVDNYLYLADKNNDQIQKIFYIDDVYPNITVLGDNPQQLTVFSSYTELGATAYDINDGDLSDNIVIGTNSVNMSVIGSYLVYYVVTDSAGNTSGNTRTLNIVDLVAPIVNLTGDNPQVLEVNTSYIELGATASDNYDQVEPSIIINTSSLDMTTTGEYEIYYTATDMSRNMDFSTRAVHIVDTTVPEITLIGNPQAIEIDSAYIELGAIVNDNYAITADVVIDTTAINTGLLGSYEVYYSATDDVGNISFSTRTVNIVDTTVPVITLLGDAPKILPVFGSYSELGATALDNNDGDISGSVAIDTSSINMDIIGNYAVIYSVTDSQGNTGSLNRIINVIDSTAPIVSLEGDNPQTLEVNTDFIDLGATAIDNYDQVEPSIIINTSSLDMTVTGQYEVYYTATDISGNIGVSTRTVNILDTTAPVITLVGDNPQNMEFMNEYLELGATVRDNYDSSFEIMIDTSNLNVNTTGQYEIYYQTMDMAANISFATRTVHVNYVASGDISMIDLTSHNIVSWSESVDDKVGILRYHYQVGSESGTTADMMVDITGLLTEGESYQASVYAENNVGLYSNIASINFVYYDSEVLNIDNSEANIMRDSAKINLPEDSISGDFYFLSIIKNFNDSNIQAANDRLIDAEEKANIMTIGLFMDFTAYAKVNGMEIKELNKNILIALPYAENINIDKMGVYYLNETTSKWEKLVTAGIDRTNRFISFETKHLSTFALLPNNLKSDLRRLNIYPNPSYMRQDNVKISGLVDANLDIKIFDILGKQVKTFTENDFQEDIYNAKFVEWNGKDDSGIKLASGVYFCVIKNNNEIKKEKIAIMW